MMIERRKEFIIIHYIVNIIIIVIHILQLQKGIETFRYVACFDVNLIVSP